MSETVRTAAEVLANYAYLENGKLMVSGGDVEIELADITEDIRKVIQNNAMFLAEANTNGEKMVFKNNGSVYGPANDVIRIKLVEEGLGIKDEDKKMDEFMSLAASDSVHSLADKAVFPIAQEEKSELMKVMK